MARLAAIDIGSNALRLRIVEADAPLPSPDGPRFSAFRDVFVDRAAVRLGRDVFMRGRIDPSVIGQACDALRRFRAHLDAAKVDRYRAVATSAVREAQNGDVFVERVEREAGLHVEVIEGVEEARLVQIAVIERVRMRAGRAVLVDIGGGSTEITLLVGGRPMLSRSLPIGTVRLVEAFLGKGPIDEVERRLLHEYVDRSFVEVLPELMELTQGSIEILVGTGGNIETLAELCPVPSAFPEGRAIDVANMKRLLDELAQKSVDERATSYHLRPDRADTIVPAAAVLARVADAFGQPAIVAPGVGLKEGVLLDLARLHFVPDQAFTDAASVHEACLRLGRRYRFDEAHGARVAKFATRLFDDLSPRHGLGPRDRTLLHAAALLHDVGDFVRYEGHHKHSYYLILHSDIMGLTPAERTIVANVARYHRKSAPTLDHDNFRDLSPKDRGKVKAMAAVLRIADALDREHLAKVEGLSARIEDTSLVLVLEGTLDRALEEWTVLQKAGMLKDALGLDVKIEGASVKSTRRGAPSPASIT